MGQTVKIIGQRGGQLLLTDSALFKDQFLHCSQAVTEVGNTHLQTRYPVILRAALLNAFRPLNAVVYQRGAQNIVHVLFQHGIDDILNFDGFTRVVADLCIPGVHHFVEIVEVTG